MGIYPLLRELYLPLKQLSLDLLKGLKKKIMKTVMKYQDSTVYDIILITTKDKRA